MMSLSEMVGQFALVRSDRSYDPVSVDVREITKVTPRLYKFAGSFYPRQVSPLSIVGVIPTREQAERLRDAIAGVAGEYRRRRRSAEEERERRITEALVAANKQVQQLLDDARSAASVDSHRMAETGTGSGRSLTSAVPKADAQ
jgi:hypothetical protein